jgi:hypothetical protein
MSTGLNAYRFLVSGLVLGAPSVALAQPATRREVPPIVRESEMPGATRPPIPGDFATPTPATVPVSTEGMWLYTAERGYVWIPQRSVGYVVSGIPAAYLYTPELGWAWYASPWGTGLFRFDGWVSRPWPLGFRTLTERPDGWKWSAPVPTAHVTGRVFGAAGHLYDADGQIVGERHAVATRSARSGSSDSEHGSHAGRGDVRHAESGHASHH